MKNIIVQKEDNSIIYQDLQTKIWIYSRFTQEGQVNLSIKLKNFVGKQDEKDEYMIEENIDKSRYLYVFSFQAGKFQQINFDKLKETQNNYEYDCQNTILQYGEKMTGYFKIYENNIVILQDNLLGVLNFDKESIIIENSIKLNSQLSTDLKFGLIQTESKDRFFGYHQKILGYLIQRFKLIDLKTLNEYDISLSGQQIQNTNEFIISYQNLLIFQDQLYQISVDQKSKMFSVKKLDSDLSKNDKIHQLYQSKLQILYGQIFTSQVQNQNKITSLETFICSSGYYMNLQRKQDDQNICSPVPTTCEKPNPQNICNCQNFNYQKSSQKCILCDSHMKFVESKDSCQNICDEGQFYNGSSCSKCLPNCLTCKYAQTCIWCDYNNGYYLDFKQNCIRCDNSKYQILNQQKNGCTCQQGYYRLQRDTK
ncbi:hypothetical protein ABPG72_022675 [Tetrahymena utriculariae]